MANESTTRRARSRKGRNADVSTDLDTTTVPNENGTETQEKTRSAINVIVPPELLARVSEEAEKADLSNGAYVRKLIADTLGFDLSAYVSAPGRRQKYATDEEREAARVASQKKRADLMKKMMKLYKSNPDILAMLEEDDDDDDDDDE